MANTASPRDYCEEVMKLTEEHWEKEIEPVVNIKQKIHTLRSLLHLIKNDNSNSNHIVNKRGIFRYIYDRIPSCVKLE